MKLLIDGSLGVYIPQKFAEDHADILINSSELIDELEILKDGPDQDEYWFAWDHILDNAECADNGYLYQDMDLWVCSE
ncbi:MAG TPA: hypothetical protein VK031_06595 [Tissierellaceae bacterium]|nr:hypothetical protein [Tissierellaceae bacterium]